MIEYKNTHPERAYNPKKDLSTVATTTKKIQEPNQAAATLFVSGSPAFHLLNTFTAPMIPTTAPMAYIRFVPASKYPFTCVVAWLIPALPSCAKHIVTVTSSTANNTSALNHAFKHFLIFIKT